MGPGGTGRLLPWEEEHRPEKPEPVLLSWPQAYRQSLQSTFSPANSRPSGTRVLSSPPHQRLVSTRHAHPAGRKQAPRGDSELGPGPAVPLALRPQYVPGVGLQLKLAVSSNKGGSLSFVPLWPFSPLLSFSSWCPFSVSFP